MLLEQKKLFIGDISTLPINIQNEIMNIKNNILLNHEDIFAYSQEITNKLSEMSTRILDSIKENTIPDTESMFLELMNQLNQIDTMDSKKNLFQKLFKKTNIDTLLTRYESVSVVFQK